MTSAHDLGSILIKPTPILLYSEMVKDPVTFLANLLVYQRAIVLVRISEREGHWVALTLNLPQKKVYFFSSFGTRPDEDKMQYVGAERNRQLGQSINFMSRLLRDYFKTVQGLEVHYNEHQYQDPMDFSDDSCGLWCALFINLGLDEEKFNTFVVQICREKRLTFKEFIRTVFKF